jgi:phage gpG-like protein
MAPTPVVRGLRIDENIMGFQFVPSLGIMAARVDKLGLDIRSFREPLKRCIQQVMAPSFRKNFEAQGRPEAWAPLADYTIERHGEHNILDLTGALMRTIQQLNVWQLTEKAASIQQLPEAVWYGNIHQGGHSAMKARIAAHKGDASAAFDSIQDDLIEAMNSGGVAKHSTFEIPARPFVMIQDEDYDGIEEVFRQWLQERINRTWLV